MQKLTFSSVSFCWGYVGIIVSLGSETPRVYHRKIQRTEILHNIWKSGFMKGRSEIK